MTTSFDRLGETSAARRTDARLTLHFATQIVAAAGHSLAAARGDDSQTSLTVTSGLFLGEPLSDSDLRVALRASDLTLLVRQGDRERETVAIAGSTLAEGLTSAAAALGRTLGRTVSLERPTYEMPEHDLARGAAFVADPEGLAELTAWFEGAALVLGQIREREAAAGPVRLWPHHFDIATLIVLESSASAQDMRSVGVGMSPGDGSYPEPYYYVSPWPYPPATSLPKLGRGHWHQQGFVAAVLEAQALLAVAPGVPRKAYLEAFLEEALSAARRLVAR